MLYLIIFYDIHGTVQYIGDFKRSSVNRCGKQRLCLVVPSRGWSSCPKCEILSWGRFWLGFGLWRKERCISLLARTRSRFIQILNDVNSGIHIHTRSYGCHSNILRWTWIVTYIYIYIKSSNQYQHLGKGTPQVHLVKGSNPIMTIRVSGQ